MATVSAASGIPPSPIDVDVLARLTSEDELIYSAGISTAGIFEIAAAMACADRKVIATTIDVDGMIFTQELIDRLGPALSDNRASLAERISLRNESFAERLSPSPDSVDVVYSRLALHYLEPAQRRAAIKRLTRLVRPDGAVFIAVRSSESLLNNPNVISFDQASGRAEIRRPDGTVLVQVRHLPTPDELEADIVDAGLELVGPIDRRLETTYENYERSINPSVDHVLFAVGHKPG